MNATVQKWGNSLALRIPMSYAKNIHIRQGSAVDMILTKDKIEIRPKSQAKKKYVLSEMLKKVTKGNIHSEVDWGRPMGREII
jgi:antitoxin MazE